MEQAKPGSNDARAAGCKCPMADNHYGEGRGGDGPRWGWYTYKDCPVHGIARLIGPDGRYISENDA